MTSLSPTTVSTERTTPSPGQWQPEIQISPHQKAHCRGEQHFLSTEGIHELLLMLQNKANGFGFSQRFMVADLQI